MKYKALVISAAAVGALALGYLGTTRWAGVEAERTLERQRQLLTDLPYFVIKSHEYQRGWFSSSERATLALNPNIVKPYAELLKLAGHDIEGMTGQDLSKLEFTYVQTVRHGPFPLLKQGDFSLLKAAVTTDFQFSPDLRETLSEIFGEQPPLQLENRIRFDDEGAFALRIPKFNRQSKLAKARSIWEGLEAQIRYGRDFTRVDIDAKAPYFLFEVNQERSRRIELKGMEFTARHTRAFGDVMLGDSQLKLVEASAKDSGLPVELLLRNMVYKTGATAQGEFVDSRRDVGLEQMVLNGKTYGPAKLVAEANHLHGPTLGKLSPLLTKIQRENPDPRVQARKGFDLFLKEGLPLLRNEPQLAIRQLSVKLPDGEVSFRADLALKGFQDPDIDNPAQLLSKLNARADLRVPKQVLETYVLWQARSMIATDTAEGEQPNAADLDNLARNLMEVQIKRLTQQKLIRVEGKDLATTAEWKAGKLLVNGNHVPLPWQIPTKSSELPQVGGDEATVEENEEPD
ncbi:YdgA family protein [Chitinimonas lacunae]|uniref:YdgA family protein n=1 Tax=Chitinimonas lacunae TaxID=1963018 RepID=A0ABV8MTB9_9NEIS